jgi:hypothetical protein
MAILINRSINISGGIEINQLYVRLEIINNFSGKTIEIKTKSFASKQAYDNNNNSSINVDNIPRKIAFSYDRDIDGIDTLVFSHEKLKQLLTLNPQVIGSYIEDPSTGEQIPVYVDGEPWVRDTSIFIIDISINS